MGLLSVHQNCSDFVPCGALLRSPNRGATKCTAQRLCNSQNSGRFSSEVALRSTLLRKMRRRADRIMYYVYILQDLGKKRYVGYSHDLKGRLRDHQAGSVTTTSTYTHPELVWYCAFRDKKMALDFERYLKAGSGYAFATKHLLAAIHRP